MTSQKKSYSMPRLTIHGNIETVTRSSSPVLGFLDNIYHAPGGLSCRVACDANGDYPAGHPYHTPVNS